MLMISNLISFSQVLLRLNGNRITYTYLDSDRMDGMNDGMDNGFHQEYLPILKADEIPEAN
jgi:hypothetical protein